MNQFSADMGVSENGSNTQKNYRPHDEKPLEAGIPSGKLTVCY